MIRIRDNPRAASGDNGQLAYVYADGLAILFTSNSS